MSSPDYTFAGIVKLDKQLSENKELPELQKKYFELPSDDVIAKTVAALEAHNHKVYVADNKAAALSVVQELVPEGASVYSGGSVTLDQIGLIDHLKAQTKWKNLKTPVIEAESKGDHAAAAEGRKAGFAADYFIASAAAVSQAGDIVWGSLTGTRVSAHQSGNVVFVVGAQKITPTYDDAVKRLYEWQLLLESARARDAYKAFGVTASAVNEVGAIRGGNPFAPGRVHVVIVKEALGY